MSSKVLVVEELWNIYSFYTLHGDPLDPEHLRPTQLTKMLSKDCGLVVKGGDLLEADIYNAYQAEVTRSDKIAPGDARPHSALKMSLGGPQAKLLTDRKKVRGFSAKKKKKRRRAATKPRPAPHTLSLSSLPSPPALPQR